MHRGADIKDRLAELSVPEPNTGCWLWLARTDRRGYGRLAVGGRRARPAHRVAYEAFRGAIGDGMFVCHRCDVPACVNPAHLFLGTPADNARDRDRKGRASRRDRSGERNGRARLTEADVLVIRALPAVDLAALSRKYGVDRSTIRGAITGKSWCHLPGAVGSR